MSGQLRWSILKHFASRNSYGFTFQDVVKEFPEKNRIHLARILEDILSDKGAKRIKDLDKETGL